MHSRSYDADARRSLCFHCETLRSVVRFLPLVRRQLGADDSNWLCLIHIIQSVKQSSERQLSDVGSDEC